jgi:hypothetical protein
MKKYCIRISKYNPKYRNEVGDYILNEWSSISDIWEHNVDWNEYRKVEWAYVKFIVDLLKMFDCSHLEICGLENNFKWNEFEKFRISGMWIKSEELFQDIIIDGKRELNIEDINIFIKFLLREMLWWLLVSESIEIRVGYDFYMYILTSDESIEKYLLNNQTKSLFIESIDPEFIATN